MQVSKDKCKEQKSDNEKLCNKNKIPDVPEENIGVVIDAVLDYEQEATGYNDGDLHAATVPDNKVHINDHKTS